jgi:hypothetical protein
MKRIPPSVVERLGWYVYAYVHRTDRRIHYVGKGIGQRALAHLMRLRRHRVDIVAHGLNDEATAYAVERALIDGLGLRKLTNKVRGKSARQLGREPLEDLIYRYAARRVNIDEPSVLIRVNRLYRPGMGRRELYEITRGVWKIGRRRDTLRYALAVYRGVVREVYRIRSWHRGGTTRYRFRHRKADWARRWEFLGSVAEPSVRHRYVGGSVAHLLPDGAQNPIRYVPSAET